MMTTRRAALKALSILSGALGLSGAKALADGRVHAMDMAMMRDIIVATIQARIPPMLRAGVLLRPSGHRRHRRFVLDPRHCVGFAYEPVLSTKSAELAHMEAELERFEAGAVKVLREDIKPGSEVWTHVMGRVSRDGRTIAVGVHYHVDAENWA